MNDDRPLITIYTDGAADPNPGPGGWAAILSFGQHRKQLTGSETHTTNNRMELTAAIQALQALKRPSRVEFHTDSEYLRQGVTEWLPSWQARNWKTADKQPVKNQDLWQALAEAVTRHQITWHWVKGHAGDPLNEQVDRLATAQIPPISLPLDDSNSVHIFLAASGRGHWAALLHHGANHAEISGTEAASANRLLLHAAIEALRAAVPGLPVHLYTTSDYLYNGAVHWLNTWKDQGWRKKDGKPVQNADLWQALASASLGRPVTWHRVKENAPAEMKDAERLSRVVD